MISSAVKVIQIYLVHIFLFEICSVAQRLGVRMSSDIGEIEINSSIEPKNSEIDRLIKEWLIKEKKERGRPFFDFFESCDLGYMKKSERRKYLYERYLLTLEERLK